MPSVGQSGSLRHRHWWQLTTDGQERTGYIASTFIYQTYSLQHAAWANKLASCGAPSSPLVAAKGAMAMPGLPDDFETRAREVLGEENPKLLADLLALRSEASRFAAQK